MAAIVKWSLVVYHRRVLLEVARRRPVGRGKVLHWNKRSCFVAIFLVLSRACLDKTIRRNFCPEPVWIKWSFFTRNVLAKERLFRTEIVMDSRPSHDLTPSATCKKRRSFLLSVPRLSWQSNHDRHIPDSNGAKQPNVILTPSVATWTSSRGVALSSEEHQRNS